MASTYLSRTPSGGSYRTATFSCWFKRGKLDNQENIIGWDGSGSQQGNIILQTANDIIFQSYNGSGFDCNLTTNRLFRDTSAWYHIVVAIDTTQATTSDRVKIYINGVQETSFSTANYPSLNADLAINSNYSAVCSIGQYNSGWYFTGSMSHIHWIDGTAYDASYFGQFDANGVWTPKAGASVTYGTNGFFILKDSASVTDQSGNGNNFTVAGGTLTDTLDNPSNVFATLNPLVATLSDYTFYNGNTRVHNSNPSTRTIASTIGASTGKYYAEAKIIAMGGNAGDDTTLLVGITDDEYYVNNNSTAFGQGSTQVAMAVQRSLIRKNGSNEQTSLTSYSVNDVVGIALDCDNNTVQFYKNGIANGTTTAIDANKIYLFGASGYNGWTLEWNFGNGYFGTTAVASAGTNASGHGIFEYDVPTGYTALCTKGLNGE